MVVDWACGQGHHLRAGRSDARIAGGVWKAQHRIGIGHVQVLPHQRHSKRRMQALQQHCAYIHNAVPFAGPQQGDTVGAGTTGSRAAHHQAHDPALDAFAVVGLGRGIGFSHQHIAIGQHVQPASGGALNHWQKPPLAYLVRQ